MQKKILYSLPIISFLILVTSHLSSVHASATPSASIIPGDDQVITDNLKKRLQESLTIQELTSPLSQARAYIGVVKDVIKDTVIMEDKDGKKDIKLSDETTILRSPGNAQIKSENIRIDDYIIAMGYPGENNVFNGRRLIVSIDPLLSTAKQSNMGTIVKLNKSSLTLQTADKEQVITLNTKTVIKSPAGTIDYSSLAVGDTLIYTAIVDDADKLTATILMRTQTSSIAL